MRFILTGAPGAGKTVLLEALRDRGYQVIGEAATDVIAEFQARGVDEPWRDDGFLDEIALLQRRRQQEAAAVDGIQVYDRSPVCTLALAHQLGRPVPPVLAGELDRIARERVYQPRVFHVRLLGFVTPTAARRITFEDAVRFARLHEEAYRASGYKLIDVPPGTVAERADLVERCIHDL